MFPYHLRFSILLIFILFIIQPPFAQTNSNTYQKLDRLEEEKKYDSLILILEQLIYHRDVSQEKKNEHLLKLTNAYIENEDYVNASTSCTKLIKWVCDKDQSKLPKIYLMKSR